jgi:hypothetical protein
LSKMRVVGVEKWAWRAGERSFVRRCSSLAWKEKRSVMVRQSYTLSMISIPVAWVKAASAAYVLSKTMGLATLFAKCTCTF